MISRRALLGLVGALSASGCYGKFALTRKVYEWNGSLGNKFLVSLVMWVFLILPVYGITGLVDLLVLNLIEFWTGSNPMAELEHEDGSKTRFARLSEDTVRVTRVVDGKEVAFDVVMASERAVMVRGVDGRVLGSGEGLADGSIALAGTQGLKIVSAETVRQVETSARPSLAAAQVLGGAVIASR